MLRALAPLLRPEPTADGFEPEGRVVICGVSRERYLAYEPVAQSRLLPDLEIALLERCVAIHSWQQGPGARFAPV